MNYFYHDATGKQCGPVSGSALKELAANGIIKPDTVIVTEDGSKALKAEKISGLGFQKQELPPLSAPPVIQEENDPIPNIDLEVTKGQIRIREVWYTTKNITSVTAVEKIPKPRKDKNIETLFGCGVMIFASLLVPITCYLLSKWEFSWDYVWYGIIGAIGLLGMFWFADATGIIFFRSRKSYYAVMLSTSAGEKEAITTEYLDKAEKIVKRINKAIKDES